jgi:ribosomal protein S18 acetylase RimI-like enzyme
MADDAQRREAENTDVPAITEYLKRNIVLHRHLDWRKPIEWVGHLPFLMLENDGRLQALLVCPPDPKNVYWIRILASLFTIPIEESYKKLFPIALEKIQSTNMENVITSIAYQGWMQSLLSRNGWEACQQVVQLRWNRRNAFGMPKNCPEGYQIRSMYLPDLPSVALIDQASFDFLWQHSEDALRRAFEQSTYCTVAEKDGILVGYQITTLQRNRAHIARLAVLPEFQRLRIGYCLVADVINQYRKPWTREISVNTQQDNYKSLSLYNKIGFELTGESFPIFIYKQ